MLKRITLILSAAAVLAFSAITIASAQTVTEPAPDKLIPAGVDIMYRLNTEVPNPIAPLFDFALQSLMIGTTSSDTQEAKDIQDIFGAVTKENVYTIAMNMPVTGSTDIPDIFVTFSIDEATFTKLLALSGDSMTKQSYKNYNFFTDESTWMARLDGLFVMTNNQANMVAAIDNLTNTAAINLASDAKYISASKSALKDSFLDMYIRPGFVQDNPEMMNEMQPLMEMFKTDLTKLIDVEFISAAQNDSGFDLSAYVKGNRVELENANMLFNKYNFVPSLFRLVTGKKLMMYSEGNRMFSRIQDFLKMTTLPQDTWTGFNDWKKQFKTDSGIDFDTDLATQLNGQYATFIHGTDQLWPSFTLVFQAKNHDQMMSTLAKFAEYIKKEMDKQKAASGDALYTYKIINLNGGSFYNFSFNLEYLFGYTLPAASQNLSLSMGITSDGNLIVTTHPDPASIYNKSGDGILDNTSLKTMWGTQTASVNEISYFDCGVLGTWVDGLLKFSGAPTEITDSITTLFAPWKDGFSRSTATEDTVTALAHINLDAEKLSDYPAAFQKLAGYFESNQKQIMDNLPRIPVFFSDVPSDAWFTEYVNDLSGQGIINGYPDNTFRPGEPVTRAEFITMMMKIPNLISTQPFSTPEPKEFSDVPSYPEEWYTEYIQWAASQGFVNGYSDGTFHPNGLITRAEAMQILFNASTRLQSVQVIAQPLDSLITFGDVHKDDWFLTPVVAGYHFGLISGINGTTFEPNRNLTRAEAAKLIYMFIKLQAGEDLTSNN